jgi:hypothetical protein
MIMQAKKPILQYVKLQFSESGTQGKEEGKLTCLGAAATRILR